MASTNKSTTAIADLEYIQSLLQKSKSARNDIIKTPPLKNTMEKINCTTSNVKSGTAPICYKVTADHTKIGSIGANTDDGSSLSTTVAASTSSREPMQRTGSSSSVELIDDGVGVTSLDSLNNYKSHVPNTSPRDRKAILDTLREKKKIAQLQEIETSKTNIKINIKSIQPSKTVDLKRNDESEHLDKTAKCLQFETSSICATSNTSLSDDKSTKKSHHNSVDNGTVSSLPNGSEHIDIAEARPTAADSFGTPATDKRQSSFSLENILNLDPNQRSEIGKIFSEMRAELFSSSSKLPTQIKTESSIKATPPDLDDVSSEGSICNEDAAAAEVGGLDDVSSVGSGDVEEGEITEDERDITLNSPTVDRQWPHPEPDAVSHQLRVLVVGDSSSRYMVTNNGSLFTTALYHVNDTYDLLNFCTNINDRLKQDNQFDVVLIFVYHRNLIFAETVIVSGKSVELLQVRKNLSISHLLKVVEVHDKKWTDLYPRTTFIWATPYPINFLACNEARLSAVSTDRVKTLMVTERGRKANQDYWGYIKEISKNWNIAMSRTKRFPLHLPMLAWSEDRKNFRGNGSGGFPPGYLINGVQPTEHFRQQFATMFLQYLNETCPSLGVPAVMDEMPFGAVATEVNAWLAESAAKPLNMFQIQMFSNRGECFDAPELVQNTLRTYRELYTLYHNKPSQHPQYVRQREMYSWITTGAPDDELDSGWKAHWIKFLLEDFDQTWSLKREELLMRASSEASTGSSMREENHSNLTSNKILISSDSDTERRKNDRKHSRSRSKSKTSDKSRHRKSKYRSKKSSRDRHHKKKKKRRRRSISSSDAFSEDEGHPGRRRNPLDEEEDDENIDIDELIHKERANIAKKKQKKTAELKNRNEASSLSKPLSISDSTLPLTDDVIGISDGSMMSLTFKEHLSSTVQDVVASDGVNSTRNEGTDFASAITVSSECASEHVEDSSVKSNNVRDDKNKDELPFDGTVGNHDGIPSFDEIPYFEMDIDIDEKMDELIDDPDFMKDLEKFGDDLESIFDTDQLNKEKSNQEDKENEGEGITLAGTKDIVGTPASGPSICEEDKITLLNPKTIMERKGNYMVEVFRILNNVSNHFGPLSGSISNMYQKSLEYLENAQDPITLLTKNNCAILEVIYSKLKRFIEETNTPQVHRALYTIAARELRQLLDNPQPDTDMFLGVNIANIAKATLGSDTGRVIIFIKNTLMYHGLGDVPKDDVMRIFMAVKSVQLKLLENEERDNQC